MGYITDILKEIQLDYPDIKFHIYSADAQDVLDRLDKGLLDMGLLLGPIEQEKYNYLSINQDDQFGLLMPKDSELANKDILSLSDLKELPLIFPQQTLNGQQHLSWFHSSFDDFHIVATYNLVYNATCLLYTSRCV